MRKGGRKDGRKGEKKGGKDGGGRERKEGKKREKEERKLLWNLCYMEREAGPSPLCLSKQLAELRQFCLKIISQGISIPFHT